MQYIFSQVEIEGVKHDQLHIIAGQSEVLPSYELDTLYEYNRNTSTDRELNSFKISKVLDEYEEDNRKHIIYLIYEYTHYIDHYGREYDILSNRSEVIEQNLTDVEIAILELQQG